MLVFRCGGKSLCIDLELEEKMTLKEGVTFFYDDTHRPMAQFSSSYGVVRTIPVQSMWTPVGKGAYAKYVKEVA